MLVCLGDRDVETAPNAAAALADAAVRGEARRYPVTHFGFYRDEFRRQVTADEIGFLQRALQ